MTIRRKIQNLRAKSVLDDAEKEALARMEYIQNLWSTFGDLPMDPETECIEEPFEVPFQHGDGIRETFPIGTFREDIWRWFEEAFCLSVAEDLMGI